MMSDSLLERAEHMTYDEVEFKKKAGWGQPMVECYLIGWIDRLTKEQDKQSRDNPYGCQRGLAIAWQDGWYDAVQFLKGKRGTDRSRFKKERRASQEQVAAMLESNADVISAFAAGQREKTDG